MHAIDPGADRPLVLIAQRRHESRCLAATGLAVLAQKQDMNALELLCERADRASRDGGEREAEIRPAASPGMLARCADFPIGRSLAAR